MRRTLVVLASLDTVRIADAGDVIAEHPRSFDRGQQIEHATHIQALVEHKRATRQHRATDRLHHAAPSAQALFERTAQRGAQLSVLTRGLIALLDTHGASALEDAEPAQHQCLGLAWIDEFNGDTAVVAADLLEEPNRIGGEKTGRFGLLGARVEKRERTRRSDWDTSILPAIVRTIQDGRAIEWQKHVGRRDVRLKQLIARVISRITQA